MALYQNILVPTDFSDTALTAAEFAFDLASRMKSTVYMLHALHLPSTEISDNAITIIERYEELRNESYNSLNAISEILKPRFPDVKVNLKVIDGFLADAISSAVEKDKIDLVVMGTRGASGVKEYLVGSNTARVIDETTIPVFVIPNEITQKPLKKILFASDLEFEDIKSIEDLAKLATLYDVEINIIHVSDATLVLKGKVDDRIDQFKEICEQWTHYPKIQFHLVAQKESTLECIQKAIVDYNADMVCLSSSGKNLIQRIFLGSLTHKMAYHSNIPCLVFHVKESNKI